MKKTLTVSDMANEIVEADDSFSYAGARSLAEFLNDENDENAEFCVTDIVAEFQEYDSLIEAYDDLIGGSLEVDTEDSIDWSLEGDTEAQREEIANVELSNKTTIIRFKGGVVVQTTF